MADLFIEEGATRPADRNGGGEALARWEHAPVVRARAEWAGHAADEDAAGLSVTMPGSPTLARKASRCRLKLIGPAKSSATSW